MEWYRYAGAVEVGLGLGAFILFCSGIWLWGWIAVVLWVVVDRYTEIRLEQEKGASNDSE